MNCQYSTFYQQGRFLSFLLVLHGVWRASGVGTQVKSRSPAQPQEAVICSFLPIFFFHVHPKNLTHTGLLNTTWHWLCSLSWSNAMKWIFEKQTEVSCTFPAPLAWEFMPASSTWESQKRILFKGQQRKRESCDSLNVTACMHTQSRPTLCNPMDCSLPGSSVQGILQASVLKWVAISYSRGSSRPRYRNCMSCVSCIGRWILYHCTMWEAHTSERH